MTGKFIDGYYVNNQDFETFNVDINETGEFMDGYYVNNQDFETFNVDINHFDIKLSHHLNKKTK